mgnify:CR=1 FL=1
MKDKLYDPVNTGSFKMMFGFKQPSCYRHQKWVSIAKTRVTKASLIKEKI